MLNVFNIGVRSFITSLQLISCN